MSSEFSLGDIVKIVRQPNDVISKIIGEVGYIDSISFTHAGFKGLQLDGSISGCGAVKIDCLEHEAGAQWKRAKEIRDSASALERSFTESGARQERYLNRISELATKYNISIDDVKNLKLDLEYFVNQDWHL
jgi:hypothetical protein